MLSIAFKLLFSLTVIKIINNFTSASSIKSSLVNLKLVFSILLTAHTVPLYWHVVVCERISSVDEKSVLLLAVKPVYNFVYIGLFSK